jgi:hypothetical protein
MKIIKSFNGPSDLPEKVLSRQEPFLKKHLFLITDLIILLVIITGISLFQNIADSVLILFWFVIATYLISFRRYKSFTHLLISTCIATGWVYLARDHYDYNYGYYSVAGMNLLALMSWSLGMFGVLEIFNHFVFRRKIIHFLIFVLIFWVLLIFIETWAFHVIKIRNIATGTDIGLPLCNCIHAPWWMRTVYFSMGPSYYGITKIADKYSDKLILRKISF